MNIKSLASIIGLTLSSSVFALVHTPVTTERLENVIDSILHIWVGVSTVRVEIVERFLAEIDERGDPMRAAECVVTNVQVIHIKL